MPRRSKQPKLNNQNQATIPGTPEYAAARTAAATTTAGAKKSPQAALSTPFAHNGPISSSAPAHRSSPATPPKKGGQPQRDAGSDAAAAGAGSSETSARNSVSSTFSSTSATLSPPPAGTSAGPSQASGPSQTSLAPPNKMNTIFIHDSPAEVLAGPAKAFAALAPFHRDGFKHKAPEVFESIPRQEEFEEVKVGKGKDKGWAKVSSQRATPNITCLAHSYWYVRCMWAGYRSEADSVADTKPSRQDKVCDQAQQDGYGGGDHEWGEVEEQYGVLDELVKYRFKSEEKGARGIMRKLLDTGSDTLVFITERPEWRHWGYQSEEEYWRTVNSVGGRAADKGKTKGERNAYGQALIKAREWLASPDGQAHLVYLKTKGNW